MKAFIAGNLPECLGSLQIILNGKPPYVRFSHQCDTTRGPPHLPRNIEWNPGQIITLSFGDEVITFTNLGKMVAIEAPWRFEIDDGTEQSLHRRHYKKRNKRGEEDK